VVVQVLGWVRPKCLLDVPMQHVRWRLVPGEEPEHLDVLTRVLNNGLFACSVSIRSGSGQGTTDRIVSLTRLFQDRFAAAAYARAEGLRWIFPSHRPASPH
jgi:hypothetical protein